MRRFEQEARAIAALNHSNILGVHDIGQQERIHCIVTEFLEGWNLRELLMEGPVPVRKGPHIFEQIASGLAAAHNRGIIHRDLKPDNIYVSRDGQVKILDFGLAKQSFTLSSDGFTESPTISGPVTQSGMVMGTAGYMSPEQVRGGIVDHRSDVFALWRHPLRDALRKARLQAGHQCGNYDRDPQGGSARTYSHQPGSSCRDSTASSAAAWKKNLSSDSNPLPTSDLPSEAFRQPRRPMRRSLPRRRPNDETGTRSPPLVSSWALWPPDGLHIPRSVRGPLRRTFAASHLHGALSIRHVPHPTKRLCFILRHGMAAPSGSMRRAKNILNHVPC